jgi:hypothetical protein
LEANRPGQEGKAARPGNWNSTAPPSLGTAVGKIGIAQLRDLIPDLQDTWTTKVQQQCEYLGSSSPGSGVYGGNKAASRLEHAAAAARRSAARPCPAEIQNPNAKAPDLDRHGLMPRWMVEEMNGTKPTREIS